MEAADGSRLSAGKGICARQGDLRRMWGGYDRDPARRSQARLRGSAAFLQRVGIAGREPEIALGCGPYCSGRRGGRAMRPYEHAHSLSAMPPGSYGGSAGATAEKQSSVYFLKSRSKASRASLALRGGGVLRPMAGLPFEPGCPLATSRATVTRGENRVQSFA